MIINAEHGNGLGSIPNPDNAGTMIVSLAGEMRWEFGEAAVSPEIRSDVAASMDFARDHGLSEDVSRLSLNEADTLIFGKVPEQPKQIVFSLFNTRRHSTLLYRF